jgi:AAA domain
MLGAAREAWEADGCQVRGAALCGIAAEQLEAGSGIASRTVHSLLFPWEQGKEVLMDRDVLVVDEDELNLLLSRHEERVLSKVLISYVGARIDAHAQKTAVPQRGFGAWPRLHCETWNDANADKRVRVKSEYPPKRFRTVAARVTPKIIAPPPRDCKKTGLIATDPAR